MICSQPRQGQAVGHWQSSTAGSCVLRPSWQQLRREARYAAPVCAPHTTQGLYRVVPGMREEGRSGVRAAAAAAQAAATADGW